jgi:hypothetical protein
MCHRRRALRCGRFPPPRRDCVRESGLAQLEREAIRVEACGAVERAAGPGCGFCARSAQARPRPPAHGEPEAEGTTIAARRAEYWPGTGHCLHEERTERTMRLIREWVDGETANGTWLRR